MRIGLLSQWYDPEPGPAALPGVLARGLLARGHEVRVLTGFPNYPTGQLHAGYQIRRRLDEHRDGLAIRRVALFPSHDSSPVRRSLNYASFAASATLSGLDFLRGLDALWVGYSPVTVGVPMLAARHGLGLPCVTHVLDLWPDTLAVSGFLSASRLTPAVTAPLGAWCRVLYAASDAVAYISPGVGTVLADRGVPDRKLHYVPMWADEDIFHPSPQDLRSSLGLRDDNVVLVYAGALGEAQGLSTLIAACSRVQDPRFIAIIAGSGGAGSALRDQAERLGVENIRFLGRLPSQDMTALMATADVGYISLQQHPLSGLTMPSKTQAYLASGTPILAAAGGDVADVIRSANAGWVVDPSDVTAIAQALDEVGRLGRPSLRRMGDRARAYYQATFSLERGVQHVENLLQTAAERHRTKSGFSSSRRVQ